MLESEIQKRLIKQYEKQGFTVIKIIKANKAGIPDLLLIRDSIASFVEVKAPKGRITPMQLHRANELRAAGCQVRFVTDGDLDLREPSTKSDLDF